MAELRGQFVVLRPWRESDAQAVHAACQDEEILRWIPQIPRPYTLDDAHAYVDGAATNPLEFAVMERDGALVGSVGMSAPDRAISHAGYWVAREARGRGLATDALRTLCHHGFLDHGLDRIDLVTDVDNRASQRVAEKAGFQREGVLRSYLTYADGRGDAILFSLLPGELQLDGA
jgi:RimJ/RimL family protein N-acetyltransferase